MNEGGEERKKKRGILTEGLMIWDDEGMKEGKEEGKRGRMVWDRKKRRKINRRIDRIRC